MHEQPALVNGYIREFLGRQKATGVRDNGLTRMPGSASTPATNLGGGCLVLFGLPFAITGLGLGVATFGDFGRGPMDTSLLLLRSVASLVFAGAGIGLMAMGVVGSRAARRKQALLDANPDKPWLWREDWAQGLVKPEWNQGGAVLGVMGLFFLLMSVPISMQLPEELLVRHRYVVLVALVFPLAGLLLVWQSVLGRQRAMKFRGLRFVLSTLPGVIGGKLKGNLECSFVFPPGRTVDLTLSCVTSYVSGSGNSRSRWQTVLWQKKRSVTPYAAGAGSWVPVEFSVPFDTRETDMRNPNYEILWRLSAGADLPGADFRASFVTPVFKTSASDATLTAERMEAEDAGHLAGTMPPGSHFEAGTSPLGGVQFHLPAGRNKGVAATVAVFGIIFLSVGLFFEFVGSGAFGFVAGLIPLVFAGGFGLLMIAFGVWLAFDSTTIGVVNRELHVRTTCLGFSRSRTIVASEIRKFELHSSMQSGDMVWYDVRAALRSGRTVTAASNLEKDEAEWFAAELKKDLGI